MDIEKYRNEEKLEPSANALAERVRLIHEGEVTGYRLDSEGQQVYSRDGMNWRKEPLPHQFVERCTGLKDKTGRPVYWGDCILARQPDGGFVHFAIVGPMESLLLGCLKTRQLRPLCEDAVEISVRYSRVTGRLDLANDGGEVRAALSALNYVDVRAELSHVLAAFLLLTLGTLLSALVENALFDEISPVFIFSGASAVLGCLFLFVKLKSRALTRKWLIGLSKGVALFGLFLGLSIGGLAQTDTDPWRTILAYGLFGALLPATFTIISGDIVTWFFGGYDGELPQDLVTVANR